MSEQKIECLYGLTVYNPRCTLEISYPEQTWLDSIRDSLREFLFIASQAFLLALSITCFRLAFGGF